MNAQKIIENTNKHGNTILCWPESQEIMGKKGMEMNCALINDEDGLDIFGSSAYVVKTDWYKQIAVIEDMDDEDELDDDWLQMAMLVEDEDGNEYYSL